MVHKKHPQKNPPPPPTTTTKQQQQNKKQTKTKTVRIYFKIEKNSSKVATIIKDTPKTLRTTI